MARGRILFAEDDEAGRQIGAYNLREHGYEVSTAESGDEALKLFQPGEFDVVITDVKMPGRSGLDLMTSVLKQDRRMPVIVVTGYADITMAVDSMKKGAFDFIGKPFSRDHLLLVGLSVVDQATQRVQALLLQPVIHDVDGGPLLADEQHPLAPRHVVGDEVGDGL